MLMDDADPARVWCSRMWPVPARARVPVWERVELVVRAAVVASVSEAEFVRRVRAAGIAMWASGFDVSGAARGFVIEVPVGSGVTRADSVIAADLGLEVLREQWDHGSVAVGEARRQWWDLREASVFDRERIVLSHPVIWSRMIDDAIEFTHELRTGTGHRSLAWWGWAAGRLAGAFAAWALRAEPHLDGAFTAAVRCLRESATTAGVDVDPVVARRRRAGPDLGRVAFGLTHLCAGADDPARALLLLIQLSTCVLEVSKAHRRRGESGAARAVDGCASGLRAVCECLHVLTTTGEGHDSS